jgi:prephenate dehydrogenase
MTQHIAIIGTGLIGGSIALGLKKQLGNDVFLYGINSTLERSGEAKSKGIIDKELDSINTIPHEVTLIILATPVQTTIQLLNSLKDESSDCIIIDVGSTKQTICHNAPANFIGTHPMAGKEVSGFEHASADLFVGKPWIICPTPQTKETVVEKIKQLVQILQAVPVVMDAQTHDEVVAWASHLSLALSSIIIHTIKNQPTCKEIEQIASTGLRDTTRLASENPEMKRDIFMTNTSNIIFSLRSIQKEIDSFCQMLENRNSDEIYEFIKQTKKHRDDWIASRPDLTA